MVDADSWRRLCVIAVGGYDGLGMVWRAAGGEADGRLALREFSRQRMHPLLLRFDDRQLEHEFVEDYNRAALPQARRAGVLAIFLYGIFGVLDTQVAPAHLAALYLVRFGIVCPYIVLMLVMSYRSWVGRIQQLALCSVVVLGSWGLAVMPLIAPVPSTYAATGTLLILMFLFAFIRVRLAAAVPTALLVIVGYETALLASGVSSLTVIYNNFFLLGFVIVGVVACRTLELLRRREYLRERELQRERGRSDLLLHNILPQEIAQRLRQDPSAIADGIDGVSVLFADIVGFTAFAEQAEAEALVAFLDDLFARFDLLCERHRVEKIKTIGDAYMAVAGVPQPHSDHAAAAAELALDMMQAAAATERGSSGVLQLRIGISSGPVIAGVIGRRKFAYDLWGDTVNTASRMESHGRPGSIQVSQSTRSLLDTRYVLTDTHEVIVKGKGPLKAAYLLDRAL